MAEIHPLNRKGNAPDAPPPPLSSFFPTPKTPPISIKRASEPKTLREPPLPLSQLDPTPNDIPEQSKSSIIKVNELAPKDKLRAYAFAGYKYVEFETPEARAIRGRIAALKHKEKLGRHAPPSASRRTASAPVPPSPSLETIHETDSLQEERVPGRSLARLIISAPPGGRHVLERRVPGSPMGNAWSGEHYWAPQFSPQVMTPRRKAIKGRPPEGVLALQHPQSGVAYHAVRAGVKTIVDNITAEAKERGYPIATINKPETEVLAAKRVLESQAGTFAWDAQFLHLPPTISSRLTELAGEESRAISSWSIKTNADLVDVKYWMRVDESTFQVSTILDSAREALAIIKGQRKDKELQIPEAAWMLIHAVSLLDGKERDLERRQAGGGKEDESSEEEGYGFFLKSIAEEVKDSVERRKRRESEKSGSKNVGGSMLSMKSGSTVSVDRVEGVPMERASGSSDMASNASRHIASFGLNDRQSIHTKSSPTPSTVVDPIGRRNVSLGTPQSSLAGESISQGDSAETRRYGSLGRKFDIESRKLRGKAPSVLDLASWAEELKSMEMAKEKKREAMAVRNEEADSSEEIEKADKSEEIGKAITKD